MFYRYRRWLKTYRFDWQIAGILNTPPMRVVAAPWSIVSMVADSDVRMYLLAIKSFYARIGRGQIVAIVDRDAAATTRSVLSEHLPGIEFVVLEDIDTGRCQRGGTWERLCYVLDRSEHEYVIQVDCDTLPLRHDLDEILACANSNRPFAMAGSEGWGLRTMRESALEAKQMESDHICIVTERLFDRFPAPDTTWYVRGSSGLAGFSKGGFKRSGIEEFHDILQPLLGERWREWGTEQCGSNFALANSPDPLVLECPLYRSYDPEYDPSNSKFLHFIGTARFTNGFFAERGKINIAELSSAREQRANNLSAGP